MNEKLTPRELGVDTAPYRAIDTTMADLGRTLSTLGMNPSLSERSAAAMADLFGRPRPSSSPALDAAIARIDRSVTATLETIDEPYVEAFVAQPYLITRAVYGPNVVPVWPPEGKTVPRVLLDCRDAQKALVGTGAADMLKVHQLRRARTAIERLIAAEDAG